MENNKGTLCASDEHKLLELYKELGSDIRHYDRHVYIVNFQMVPALVIGLLVLYGGIKKLLGIELEHLENVVYDSLVWVSPNIPDVDNGVESSCTSGPHTCENKTAVRVSIGIKCAREVCQDGSGTRAAKIDKPLHTPFSWFLGVFLLASNPPVLLPCREFDRLVCSQLCPMCGSPYYISRPNLLGGKALFSQEIGSRLWKSIMEKF